MNRYRNRFGYASLLILAVIVCGTQTSKSQDEPVIRVETSVLNIPISVRDGSGKSVNGLAKEDFELVIDKKKQTIDFFEDKGLVNIAIIIDANSNTSEVIGQIRRDAQRFIDLLGSTEKAMVIRLDMGYRVVCELTSDKRKLRDAVGKIDSHRERARLMDYVLHQTIYSELANAPGKKAVVIFGDPDSAISWYDIKPEVSLFTPEFLAESDVVLFPIFYQTSTFPREDIGKTLSFDQLLRVPPIKNFNFYAALTGGRFYAAGAENFKSGLNQIIEDIRNQYLLGVHLDDDANGKRKTLMVGTTRRDLIVTAKTTIKAINSDERQRWITRMMVNRQN